MRRSHISEVLRAFALLLLVPAIAAGGPAEAELAPYALAGKVTTSATPLAQARVYAYQVSDLSLRRVDTDPIGSFLFESLPAGLYKIIAVKSGFVPAVVLLQRQSAEAAQYLEVDLAPQDVASVDGGSDFWSLRKRIPSDVLRDLESLEMAADGGARAVEPGFTVDETRFTAMTGADDVVAAAGGMNRGTLGMTASVGATEFDLNGDHWVARADPTGQASHSSLLEVSVTSPETGNLTMVTSDNRLDSNDAYEAIDLERYQVSWSQQLGPGSSNVRAEVVDEHGFFSSGGVLPAGLPGASRSLNLEGTYDGVVVGENSLSAGFRYRQVEGVDDASHLVPEQRIDLFGLGQMLVRPRVLVEYGLYSKLRDGSLSLIPQGGVVVELGANWTASTMASYKVHEDDPLTFDFVPVQFATASSSCQGEDYCYQFELSRDFSDRTELAIGATHRRFDETLRLYFNDDFFSHFESLYLVDGDELPEVRVAMSHRLTPTVVTRLESSVASGGGGVFQASDDSSYENNVSYVVTSLDTRFETTDTGVFLAFHHLEQHLASLAIHDAVGPETDFEMQRLQLLLTQDLSALNLSSFALRLNMEVSRGDLGQPRESDDEELYKRIMGGVAVSF
jgi:hypothetical protein